MLPGFPWTTWFPAATLIPARWWAATPARLAGDLRTGRP